MRSLSLVGCASSLAALASGVSAQRGETVPNSFPHAYPGIPSGDFSQEWQDCECGLIQTKREIPLKPVGVALDFLVQEGSLPNVTFPLSRNFAGNIPVNRTNHPNDTLFFWGFENSNGSLTQDADANTSAPWGLWLNGG